MGKLLFVGDSITAGAWDPAGGGWAVRVGRMVAQKNIDMQMAGNSNFYCLPYNLGISGDTAAGVAERLAREVQPRLDGEEKNEVIHFVIAIGANDSMWQVAKNKPLFTDAEYKAGLEKIVEVCRSFNGRMTFVGLCPLDDDRLNPIPWAPDLAYQNARAAHFENIVADIASSAGAAFIPMHAAFMAQPEYKKRLFDGAHPDSEGHAFIAARVAEALLTPEFYQHFGA